MSAATMTTVDFDVHGLAGVRLLNASPAEAAAVDRQLGPVRGPLQRDPDLVVRFVERLAHRGSVRLLGAGEFGYDDESFLVLRSRHKVQARVAVPLDRAGEHCELVCERGLPAVPLLVALLNLTILRRGVVPLHASAFMLDGEGTVVTGWSKGGKTELLLGALAAGASYVGDEWVYVDPATRRVWGLAEPIRLWSWQLRQRPDLLARLRPRDRVRLGALDVGARLPASPRVTAVMRGQQHVDVTPGALFGEDRCVAAGRLDRLVLAGSWERPDIAVRPVDAREVAERMTASLRYERLRLTAAHEAFRFAFPDRANPWLVDEAQAREHELLAEAFAGVPAVAVDHPSPVSLEDLFAALQRSAPAAKAAVNGRAAVAVEGGVA